jgi:hypothetical protein
MQLIIQRKGAGHKIVFIKINSFHVICFFDVTVFKETQTK